MSGGETVFMSLCEKEREMFKQKYGYGMEITRTLYPVRIPITRWAKRSKKPYCIIDGRIRFCPRCSKTEMIK